MSGFFLPLMSAFNFSAHERMLISGEHKIILFNLYDHILLQAYFRPLKSNFTLFMTFWDISGLFLAFRINF
jgi:hypothetical protein